MKMIISPAKKMRVADDIFTATALPPFVDEAALLTAALRTKDSAALKSLWQCNDKLVALNQARLATMDVHGATTPALMAYEGLQYQHMAPEVLCRDALAYLDDHLRILSGFYGVLRPFDAVMPYRLEMQAKLAVGAAQNLYEFWGRRLYDALDETGGVIINLASAEYSKAITPYLQAGDCFVTLRFGEVTDGKFKQKGTFAKMARGEMVRYMAETQAKTVADLQDFDALGLAYAPEWSDTYTMSFVVAKEEA